MNPDGQTISRVHKDARRRTGPVRKTGQGGRPKPDPSTDMVDQHDGAGRGHPRSVCSRKEEIGSSNIVGIAVHGLTVSPKQGDRARKDGRHYTDGKVKANAGALAMLIGKFAPTEPWEGPLACELVFGLPFRARETALSRGVGWAWADTKPDVDNLVKQMLDTLQACRFFKNDSQVAQLVVTKVRMERPVIHVRLFKLEQLGRKPWFLLNCPS